ncbi:MAG: D-alanyl-D-alanine carboxypeptidase [Desulfobulbaceae bacterium]|nr:D-alanyl-D-alanine carboxypeptidase [Desulfobulbaceae bacterium]
MGKSHFNGVLFLLISLLSFCCSWQAAHATCHDFSDIIHSGGYAVADETGRIISSCNPDTPFIPASIIKIQTALAAFHILGRDFRFQTAFYMDGQNNLYIVGSGDPLLISEEVERLLVELRNRNVSEINSIFVDNSRFSLTEQVPGSGQSDNPFDSPVSATGVNFNTVSIRVNEGGEVVSAEPQTPTLPIMKEMGRGLEQGVYRLNICQGKCTPDERTARYTAELFRGLQRRAGIPGNGRFGIRHVPSGTKLIYTHENSRNLDQVVASFLEYSNNYIANQVFLTCGAGKFGYPATWDKARRAVQEALEDILGSETASMTALYEGSGLSRRTSTTAFAMIRSLAAFKPYQELIQEKNGNRVKSGTLDGVYNYAGYLHNEKPFVILLNQEQNTRESVLQRLERLTEHDRNQ